MVLVICPTLHQLLKRMLLACHGVQVCFCLVRLVWPGPGGPVPWPSRWPGPGGPVPVARRIPVLPWPGGPVPVPVPAQVLAVCPAMVWFWWPGDPVPVPVPLWWVARSPSRSRSWSRSRSLPLPGPGGRVPVPIKRITYAVWPASMSPGMDAQSLPRIWLFYAVLQTTGDRQTILRSRNHYRTKTGAKRLPKPTA